jgi:DNA repair exonuclease SbcCD nuclease subunit
VKHFLPPVVRIKHLTLLTTCPFAILVVLTLGSMLFLQVSSPEIFVLFGNHDSLSHAASDLQDYGNNGIYFANVLDSY